MRNGCRSLLLWGIGIDSCIVDTMKNDQSHQFWVGQLYAIEEIQKCLGVGNAGGVRLSLSDAGIVQRAVVLTSPVTARQARENPYYDRIENGILVYTGAGREGDQSLSGVNKRFPQQLTESFPIYAFTLIASRRDRTIGSKRWRFLGLLEYVCHYPDSQVDTRNNVRKVWLFEFRIHAEPATISVAVDRTISQEILTTSRRVNPFRTDDREIVTASDGQASTRDPVLIEAARARLLATDPQQFEQFVKKLLVATGFDQATVTRFSQDGGIDVNAYAGTQLWPLRGTLIQVQAKRWLHTVGRREVAELRGSLQPFARGVVVTTSHFSRAAVLEASEPGKLPIVLIDGYQIGTLALEYAAELC
jgi:hypothetical protein